MWQLQHSTLVNNRRSVRAGNMERIKHNLDAFFAITERGGTVEAEIRAGVTGFLTMSYILLVIPQIMSQIGFSPADTAVATAIASATASLIVGLCGNLPFGMAPGTGLSAYLAYGLVLSGYMDRSEAMTTCFLSGLLLGLCGIFRVFPIIMKIIPRSVKLATVVGMGLLIALIGMVSIRLVVPNTDTLVDLGDLWHDYHIWLAMGGLILTGSLLFHEVRGGILASIIAITLIVWSIDDTWPAAIAKLPTLRDGIQDNLDFSSLRIQALPPLFAFLLVGIFDVSGVLYGLSSLAKILNDEGQVRGSLWAFIAASVGTVVAAMAGSSPVIIHLESAAAIREGGRTGLTAVVIGVLFLLSIFFAPLFGKVPSAATAPILVLVGSIMIGEARLIDWTDMSEAIPAFLTTMLMPFTFSIPNGILFGIGMSIIFSLTTGDFLQYLPAARYRRRRSELAKADVEPRADLALKGRRPVSPGGSDPQQSQGRPDGSVPVNPDNLYDANSCNSNHVAVIGNR